MAMTLKTKNKYQMVKISVNVRGINMRFHIVLCLTLFVSGCGDELCSNTITNEYPSADGKYIATTFVRDCGATTPYITVVSMRYSDSSLEMNDHEDWLFTAHDKATVDVKWESNNTLLVQFTSSDSKATQRTTWKDLSIQYKKH